MLPLPLIAPSAAALGAILFVFGAANGAMDVSMNAHGVAVERELGAPDHVLAARRLERRRVRSPRGSPCSRAPPASIRACGARRRHRAVARLASPYVTARLGSASTHSEGSGFALPSARRDPDRRAVLSDDDRRGRDRRLERDLPAPGPRRERRGRRAPRFTGFSPAWRSRRLGGDWLNERLGAGLLLRGGMALVALALGGVLLIGEPIPAVIGFALVGLGIANTVPILFSAAGRHEPAGPSLAAVFTVGYTGFIVGPPLIGALADTIGLPETLALLCLVGAVGDRARCQATAEPVATPAPRR